MKRPASRLALSFMTVLAVAYGCAAVGDTVEEGRNVERFDRIHLINAGHLVLTQGSEETLVVEADEDLLDDIRTRVVRGVLELKYEPGAIIGRFKKPTSLTYRVGFQNLDGIEISGGGMVEAESLDTDTLDVRVGGSGQVTIRQLTADSLNVVISGSGDFDLAGRVGQQNINIRGSGRYRAFDLHTASTQVAISGSGEALVNARETLDVNISGSGSVEYAGNPDTSLDISGSGSVHGIGRPLTRTQ